MSINQNGRDDDERIVWNNKNTTLLAHLVLSISTGWTAKRRPGSRRRPGRIKRLALEIGKAMEAGQSSLVLNYCREGSVNTQGRLGRQ